MKKRGINQQQIVSVKFEERKEPKPVRVSVTMLKNEMPPIKVNVRYEGDHIVTKKIED